MMFDFEDAFVVSFNSTTVQLIPSLVAYLGITAKFQFHNGTINTMMFDFEDAFVVSFNSTTVQLIR